MTGLLQGDTIVVIGSNFPTQLPPEITPGNFTLYTFDGGDASDINNWTFHPRALSTVEQVEQDDAFSRSFIRTLIAGLRDQSMTNIQRKDFLNYVSQPMNALTWGEVEGARWLFNNLSTINGSIGYTAGRKNAILAALDQYLNS